MKNLATLLITFVWALTANAWNGEGTETNPYEIGSRDDLRQLAEETSGETHNDFSGKYFKLTADINCGHVNWKPIGPDDSKCFNGFFDGNGHKVTYYMQRSSEYYQGLFGCIGKNGKVSNLAVDGSISGSTNGSRCGGIVGRNEGSVTGCHSSVDVSTFHNSIAFIGGIVGHNCMGSIGQCSASGSISNNGNELINVGGIAGYSFMGPVSECVFVGKLGTKGEFIGEILGRISGCTVSDCYHLLGRNNPGVAGQPDPEKVSKVEGMRMSLLRKKTMKMLGEFSTCFNCLKHIMVPTKITTREELAAVNNDLYGEYILMNDIDCGPDNWKPIGTFMGVFNGNGHTITYRIENATDDKQGLFSSIGNGNHNEIVGEVRHLTVKGTVSGTGLDYGGIVGYCWNGNIHNCYSAVNVSGGGYVGGIAGSNLYRSTISCCSASGTIRATEKNAGGVAGYNFGQVSTATFTGTVDAPTYAGMVVGQNPGTISGCNYLSAKAGSHEGTRYSGSEQTASPLSAFAMMNYANGLPNGYDVYRDGILTSLPEDVSPVVGDVFTATVEGVKLTFKVTSCNPMEVQLGDGSGAAMDADVQTVTLPQTVAPDGFPVKTFSVTAIDSNAFSGLNGLKSITFESEAPIAGTQQALAGLNGISVTVPSFRMTAYKAVVPADAKLSMQTPAVGGVYGNVLVAGKLMTVKVTANEPKTVQVGDGTHKAVADGTKFDTLDLPEYLDEKETWPTDYDYRITRVGEKAFGDVEIKNVDLSRNTSLLEVGDNAFMKSESYSGPVITGVVFGTGLASVGAYAFYKNGIKTVELKNVTKIGTQAFGKNPVETIIVDNLPDNIDPKNVGDKPFDGTNIKIEISGGLAGTLAGGAAAGTAAAKVAFLKKLVVAATAAVIVTVVSKITYDELKRRNHFPDDGKPSLDALWFDYNVSPTSQNKGKKAIGTWSSNKSVNVTFTTGKCKSNVSTQSGTFGTHELTITGNAGEKATSRASITGFSIEREITIVAPTKNLGTMMTGDIIQLADDDNDFEYSVKKGAGSVEKPSSKKHVFYAKGNGKAEIEKKYKGSDTNKSDTLLQVTIVDPEEKKMDKHPCTWDFTAKIPSLDDVAKDANYWKSETDKITTGVSFYGFDYQTKNEKWRPAFYDGKTLTPCFEGINFSGGKSSDWQSGKSRMNLYKNREEGQPQVGFSGKTSMKLLFSEGDGKAMVYVKAKGTDNGSVKIGSTEKEYGSEASIESFEIENPKNGIVITVEDVDIYWIAVSTPAKMLNRPSGAAEGAETAAMASYSHAKSMDYARTNEATGIDAYVASELKLNGKTLTVKMEKWNQTVAANSGVILRTATPGEVYMVAAPQNIKNSEPTPTQNYLIGTGDSTYKIYEKAADEKGKESGTDYTSYIFSSKFRVQNQNNGAEQKSDHFSFCKVYGNNLTMPKNAAYLVVKNSDFGSAYGLADLSFDENAAAHAVMAFDDDDFNQSATGIETAPQQRSMAHDNAVYNMQGVKVGTADEFSLLPSGIYIVNGKKIVKR